MRYFLFLILLISSYKIDAQDYNPNPNLEDIAKKYFSISPEGYLAKDIIQQLKSNIYIFGDTTIEKSDSTLFYFRGFTSTFNPFQITFSRIEFQIRENIYKNANNEPIDTILTFQIIGIADSTNLSAETLKKEVLRIAKNVSPLFRIK